MNNYTAVNLAGRGGGKTVLLAVFYWILSIAGADGLKLRASSLQSRKLNEVFLKVISGEDWPRGNSDTSKWTFDVIITNANRQFTVCRFTFIDYAGGHLTGGDIENEELDTIIEDCDCLTAIVDGARLLRVMQGQDDPEFFAVDIARICQIVDGGGNSPVQVLISKYDAIEGHFTLGQVRAALLKNATFARLVQSCVQRGTFVRLIPVSAVGKGFAVLQPDGSMRKTGAEIKPLNVEIPFACMLPDKVEAELTKLAREAEAMANTPVHVDPNLTFLDRIRFSLGTVATVVSVRMPAKLRFAEKTLAQFARQLQDPMLDKEIRAREEEQRRLAELAKELKELQDERSAIEYLLKRLAVIRDEFERTYPDSVIRSVTGGWRKAS